MDKYFRKFIIIKMSLPTLSYNELHKIAAEETKIADDTLVAQIVKKVHERVRATAELGYYYVKWDSDSTYYTYKHIVLAANRLRALFPGCLVEQRKNGNAIIVDWY